MTRFARARGSKSSNERLPEAATSWGVMKQQLKDKLKSSEVDADSSTSSQKIWKSSDFDRDVWNKNEVKWADLEGSESIDKAVKSGKEYNKLEKKNKKKKHNKAIATELHDTQSTGIRLAVSDDNLLQTSNAKKIKKAKKIKGANDGVSEANYIKLEGQTVIPTNNTEHKVYLTNKEKTNKQQMANLVAYDITEDTICEENGTSSEFIVENNTKKKVGKKRKRSHNSVSDLQNKQLTKKYRSELKGKEEVNLQKNVVASESRDQQLKKKHKHSQNDNTIEDSGWLNSVKQNFPDDDDDDAETKLGAYTDVPSRKHRKEKKRKENKGNKAVEGVDTSLNDSGIHTSVMPDFIPIGGREKKTKKFLQQDSNKNFTKKRYFSLEDRKFKKVKSENKYLHTTVLHVNGKDIEIVKFDGFPVKKEDAENLRRLKKKMIAKRIPASEITATMKLERRKAEKALAREKKKVCFHCRNSGHVLSECPELGKADTDDLGTGICFKCGSTEHKHFECRVTREQEFRYAKCFICNEQGHIARQCPDNPRGLYPKGGACHICGDVTHLKKDCPDLIKEKEEKVIKLQTLCNKPLEALDDDKNTKSVSRNHVKNKTVKF